MRKLIISFILLLSFPVLAGGLNASFQNSRFSGSPLNDRDTVAEYHGVVDGSNNLLDMSGANNLQWSEAFDNAAWTKVNVTVTADQVRGPYSWTANADLLTPTAADSYVYQDDAGAAAGETHTCSFQLRSEIGNVDLSIHVYNQAHGAIRGIRAITVTPHWRLYQVQGVLIAGDTAVGCTIGGGATWSVGENIYAVRGQSQMNDEWRTGAGIYHYTDATIKPTHDLNPTNSPSPARAHLQSGGNKMAARGYDPASLQYYSKAHHNSMRVWDEDHTATFFFKHDSGAAGSDFLFSHATLNTSGIYLYSNPANNYIRARYFSGATAVDVDYTVATNDNFYHIVQVVRSGNDATIYFDGNASATVDIAGFGIDGTDVWYIGRNPGGNYWDGQISYTAIRSRALSLDELAEEREKILAIATNWSAVNHWSFSRSTVAYKTFSNAYENMYPSHSMDLVAVDAPRVAGRGSGILIEGDVTQLHGHTEAFNSWTQSGTCAVTANNYVAPNGTATADELDNTGGANIDRRVVTTANLGSLIGRTFTGSIWVRADTPHICSFYLWESGIGHITGVQDIYVTNEWQRFDASGSCAGGGTGTIAYSITPGEYGVATGVAHFWGANLTETTFATSYIPNAGAATTQVTKTADDISISVLEAGTNNRILADEYCQGCAADKITLFGEWKAEWSSNADIGQDRRLVNMGNVASANNDLELYVSSAGNVFLRFQDDAGTVRTINSAANPVDFSNWFSVRGVVDFTDLSRSELYINEAVDHAADSGNWTAGGGATYNTDGNEIRIGATRTGIVDGFHWTILLRETNSEVRP